MSARVKVALTEEQAVTLRMWAASGKTEQRMALRAKVVLLAAEGQGLREIEQATGLHWQSCLKWRKRFLAYGLDGLKDQARRGRPQSITREERESVVALAHSAPSDGSSYWSVRKLAEATGHSKSAVQQILTKGTMPPPGLGCWSDKPAPPAFEQKQVAIVGLYLAPSHRALVLAVDSKPQKTACGRSLSLRLTQPTATGWRQGTTSLMDALAAYCEAREKKGVERAYGKPLRTFLQQLRHACPDKRLCVILDSQDAHDDQETTTGLAGKHRLTVHHTPTASDWLAQVELWFAMLACDGPGNSVWRLAARLVGQLVASAKTDSPPWPEPFQWTFTGKPVVDQI